MEIKEGYKVKVDYVGKLDDGQEFDNSAKHGAPLEFQVGAQMVVPGFEKALLGMSEGEEKDVDIKPEDAYGNWREELVRDFPKDQVPVDAAVGTTLYLQSPDGQRLIATILEVTEDKVKMDMNHPLAGKSLHFHLKVVGVEEAELSKGCSGGGCGSGACGNKEGKEDKEGGCGSGKCHDGEDDEESEDHTGGCC